MGTRLGAVVIAFMIGVTFTLKPKLVPLEGGFLDGGTFPYNSATARIYWGPGVLFLLLAAGVVVTINRRRWLEDLRRLRPTVGVILIAALSSLATYSHVRQPTVYDVYLPFREKYRSLREQLQRIASDLDIAKSLSGSTPLKAPLDPPLVLDLRSRIRNEDIGITGHILFYEQLTHPDQYLGGIEHAVADNLWLNLRDTGPEPVLYWEGFAQFADRAEAVSLQRVLEAPYLVIIVPLSLNEKSGQDPPAVLGLGPCRVCVWNLKTNQFLYASAPIAAAKDSKARAEAVYARLEADVKAKLVR